MSDSIETYAQAHEELIARKTWTMARLAEQVDCARAEGWLPGMRLPEASDAEAQLAALDPDARTPTRLLARRLELSDVELDVLWLLACVELEPALARAAELLFAAGMHELSAQTLEHLAMRSGPVDGEMFDRLARWGLVETEVDPRVPRYRRAVRASDRLVDLARGCMVLDRELRDVATLTSAVAARREPAGEIVVSRSIARALCGGDALVVATGTQGSGRATLLSRAISATGAQVLRVNVRALAVERRQLARQCRAIVRECRLHGAMPLLIELDGADERFDVIERELLVAHRGPVLATAREPLTRSVGRPVVSTSVQLPDAEARRGLWQRALPSATEELVDTCARRYAITPGLVARTAAAVTTSCRAVERLDLDLDLERVHGALRAQLEQDLLGLATRIETTQTWDDLVLPVEQFDMLIELAARVRHRERVLDTWGFGAKVGRGRGLAALFSGPPGTGKTMIAGLLARELGLDLYQVDLSRIVSKYIGETEKQLAKLFDAASAGHAILLSDEADSLFGKRTEVKSSNDRYANLEVNYLLQRMEQFDGISILTTNHEAAIDPAFQRRLAFHVRVPTPDENQRALIWAAMLPDAAERDASLDVSRLATEFEMSGGYIKNAVLRAAYLAADAESPIRDEHLWRAARAEYEAMGKLAFAGVR
jgi:hypothetical protein